MLLVLLARQVHVFGQQAWGACGVVLACAVNRLHIGDLGPANGLLRSCLATGRRCR